MMERERLHLYFHTNPWNQWNPTNTKRVRPISDFLRTCVAFSLKPHFLCYTPNSNETHQTPKFSHYTQFIFISKFPPFPPIFLGKQTKFICPTPLLQSTSLTRFHGTTFKSFLSISIWSENRILHPFVQTPCQDLIR